MIGIGWPVNLYYLPNVEVRLLPLLRRRIGEFIRKVHLKGFGITLFNHNLLVDLHDFLLVLNFVEVK